MAFTPRAWFTGQVVNAADANRWEQGIDAASAGGGDAAVAANIGDPASSVRGALSALLTSGQGITPAASATFTDVQAALNTAASTGTRATAYGTITTSSTLIVKADCDLSQLTINYTGAGVAIQVGDPSTPNFRKTVKLPTVLATNKAVTGWTAVAGTIGIDVVNCYSYDVTFPLVRGFETGMRVRGAGSQGTQQSTFRVGHLDNNKVNCLFTADATGWANQNYLFGGRCSHNSGEGASVVGTRHVQFDALPNPTNANLFFGTSLESPGVVEYHVETKSSIGNMLIGCRFENSSTISRFNNTGTSKMNLVVGGMYSESLIQTGGATGWSVVSPGASSLIGGTAVKSVLALENPFSATAPIMTFMNPGASQAGADPTVDYVGKFTVAKWAGKRTADAYNRLEMDCLNGRLYLGNGITAPTAYVTALGAYLFVNSGTTFGFDTDNTSDIGAATNYRPRYVRAATAVVTGAAATGSRPNAATAKAGAMFFDTTLGKPIWSTGSAWVDATGATV